MVNKCLATFSFYKLCIALPMFFFSVVVKLIDEVQGIMSFCALVFSILHFATVHVSFVW